MSDEFDELYGQAYQLFTEQQFDAAIEAFTRASALDPSDFRPHEMTACCLGCLGRWQECLDAFERSRELGHECYQCHYNRATALCKLQRGDEALVALERSLALKADNPAAWYDRGAILGMHYGRGDGPEFMDGRHEQAVQAFDEVLRLQPDNANAWYCKAYVLYKISHSAQASHNLIANGYTPDILPQALCCIERAIELRPGARMFEDVREQIREWITETSS